MESFSSGHWVLAFHCARCHEVSIASVDPGRDRIVPVMFCEHCGAMYRYHGTLGSELICWRDRVGKPGVKIYPHWVGEEAIKC